MFALIVSVIALNAAELFYSDGTSIQIKKSENLRAVKTSVSEASDRKNAVYSMNTGHYVYFFESGKKGGDDFPVYFIGETPTVAERTVFWRGDKSVGYMESKYDMKLVEIFPIYPLYSFSVKGDSVEIAEQIVKNGDGYAFPDLLRETFLNMVPEVQPHDPYFNTQWYLRNTGSGKNYFNKDIDILKNADIKFIQTLEFLNFYNIEVDTNTKVAIMDTGVASDHEDLTNMDVGWDALDNKDGGYPDTNVSDTVDHGTKCAGISAAVGNETGMSGVCPWCGIYPVRWQKGHGSTSHYPSEMLGVYERYVADPDITTINCSFGPSSSNGVVYIYPDEIEAIRSFMQHGRGGKGGVVVYSSGNENVDSSYNRLLEYDFKFERNGVQVTDRVVTVNASTAWDTRADYSNYGYASTVIAPSLSYYPRTYVIGMATTTIPRYGDYPSDNGNYTLRFSGTSAAAPVVSGIFGVIFSINPDLTLEDALDILKRSSDKIYPETGLWKNGFSVKFGYGRVNLEKAARLAAGFQMCANEEDEICGNHLDDNCDGYVDEGCAEELTAGNPCNTLSDCISGTSLTEADAECVKEHKAWVFKGGYCFRKTNKAPCPDGTQFFDEVENYNDICALECNSTHLCARAGYYCTDEVLGICLPLCSDNSDCTSGYLCAADGRCVSAECGNGVLDDGEECDNGKDNGIKECAYGEESCTVCTTECKRTAGVSSLCGDGKIDSHYGETCDYAGGNGKTNCAYGKTGCTVCTATCQEVPGTVSYCGDASVDGTNGEICDDGGDNGKYGHCNATCKGWAARCGDGVVDTADGESCDDGNTEDGDYCSADCKTVTGRCGDGTKQSNEACDNGSDNGRTECAYGETACTVCTTECLTARGETSYCGDGRKDEEHGEKCDDGEANGENGRCSRTCSVTVEIPDDTPDEDVQDSDELPDNDDTAGEDEIPDSSMENPDSDRTSDSEDVSDGSENPDEGETPTDDGNSSDGDAAESDDSSKEPASDSDNSAAENKKKSGGCSVLLL